MSGSLRRRFERKKKSLEAPPDFRKRWYNCSGERLPRERRVALNGFNGGGNRLACGLRGGRLSKVKERPHKRAGVRRHRLFGVVSMLTG